MKRVAVVAAVCGALGWFSGPSPAGCGAQEGEQREAAAEATIESVAERPADYLHKSVRLKGRLENEGKNLFTDVRIVLKDGEGNFLHVRPWAPISLPPPPGRSGQRPPVISDFLGKEVELEAVVRRGTIRKAGEVYLLEVKSAKVVK